MNAITPAFGCAAGGVSFDVALGRVLSLVTGTLDNEEVTLMDCAGRVIASPFMARSDLPRFDQSAMDGYAVRCNDLTPGAWLPVTGRAVAGDAPGRLDPGGAHRILTGAPLPDGADAVVAQETSIGRMTSSKSPWCPRPEPTCGGMAKTSVLDSG